MNFVNDIYCLFGNNLTFETLKLKTVMDEKKMDSDPRPFKLVKQLYDSCMNTVLLEEKGLKPLQDLFMRLGGWPVVEGDSWNDKDFRWYNHMYKFRDEGLLTSSFHPIKVNEDLKVKFTSPCIYMYVLSSSFAEFK